VLLENGERRGHSATTQAHMLAMTTHSLSKSDGWQSNRDMVVSVADAGPFNEGWSCRADTPGLSRLSSVALVTATIGLCSIHLVGITPVHGSSAPGPSLLSVEVRRRLLTQRLSEP